MQVMSVQDLRDNGFSVRVTHHRRYRSYDKLPKVELVYHANHEADVRFALPHGGMTVVEVTAPDGVTYSSVAKCSDKDPFNKRLGVKIALGRIQSMLANANVSVV